MRSRLSTLSVVSALLVACGGGTPPPAPAGTNAAAGSPPAASMPAPVPSSPDDAALAAAIRAAIGMDPGDARYFDADADLDGDGRPEKLVYVAGPMVCGTGGCSLLVFSTGPDGYRLVGDISVAQTPIRLSPHSSMGWKNLVIHIAGGGIPAADAELEFDGSRYPSNPTVEPARPVSDLAGTEILIPDYHSYTDGRQIAPSSE